ncbi:MAG TPA: ATP-binding protein [Ktedonobacterales bacterium]
MTVPLSPNTASRPRLAASPVGPAARGFALPLPARLLALPVLYKVLIANSLVILLGATMGTYLATRLHEGSGLPVLVGFVVSGLLVSVAVNFILLKVAFQPLTHLRQAMRQVQDGSMDIRAPVTGQDPDADQLARAFNTMLEALDDVSRSRASQILHAQEEERKRIARELHDETSQVLTSLLISLALVEESATSEEARQRVADTRTLAHQTLRAVRNLSIDLRPSALDDLGLLPALRWYIKEYQQKCGVAVEFSTTGLKERLPDEMETALYRVIQEGLTNTAKHASAHHAWVALEECADAVHASVRDDGQGFDAPAVLRTPWQDRGLGLGGMQERATLLGGTIVIDSQPGQGTRIEVVMPLPAPAAPAIVVVPIPAPPLEAPAHPA